jgi:acyl-coenzyme A thioesterase PaaI-like protein
MKSPNQMTGLEIMQAFQQGLVPAPGIAKTMGMDGVGEVEFGRIVFIATADERHTNPLGGVHGGFAATVLILSQDARAIPYWQRVKDTARLI